MDRLSSVSSFASLLLFLTFFFFFFVEMKTKFNQELYNKIKSKKNEPLSSISQRRVKVIEKEKEKEKEVAKKGSSTPALDEGQIASLDLSSKEVTPHAKKC